MQWSVSICRCASDVRRRAAETSAGSEPTMNHRKSHARAFGFVLISLVLLFSLLSCSRSPQVYLLVDELYAAAQGTGAVQNEVESVSRITHTSIRVIVVPLGADRRYYSQLGLGTVKDVILTPFLGPDAPVLTELYPSAHVAVIGGTRTPEHNVSAIFFDRRRAMKEAGAHLAEYAASIPTHLVAVFYQEQGNDSNADLSALRAGLAEAGGAKVTVGYHLFDVQPGREEVRAAVQRELDRGVGAFAFFVGGMTPYCIELLSGTQAKVILSGAAGITAYPNQVLCSVEDGITQALEAYLHRTDGTATAQSIVQCTKAVR